MIPGLAGAIRKWPVFLVPLALLWFSAGTAEAAPEGEARFRYTHREQEIEVLTYRPATFENGPLLVLFHGATRDASGYLQSGKVLADRFGMLLAVPEFDRRRFDPEAFQEGGVFKNQQPAAPEAWTFTFVRPLVEEIRRRESRPEMPYYLVGHSAGAQFAGRLAAFLPESATRIVVVNAGSLLFPSRELPYPYGFDALPEPLRGDEALRRYLATPLSIYIGTADTGSERLPTGPAARQQGATRIERARHCFEAGRRLAEEHAWPFAWTLVEAEGLDHRSTPMWRHENARTALLGPPQSGEENPATLAPTRQ